MWRALICCAHAWKHCFNAVDSAAIPQHLVLDPSAHVVLHSTPTYSSGSVWVFAIPDAAEGKACSPELYSFIWWFVVISWATLGFFFCCGCCAVCLLCSAGAAEAANQ